MPPNRHIVSFTQDCFGVFHSWLETVHFWNYSVVGTTSTSWWRNLASEPAVFVHEVAKQHDSFAGAIAFGVLVSARASFWLDKMIRKLFEYFNEDLPKPEFVPQTVLVPWVNFALKKSCFKCDLYCFALHQSYIARNFRLPQSSSIGQSSAKDN